MTAASGEEKETAMSRGSAGYRVALALLVAILTLGGCRREEPPAPPAGDHLILLHGLARSSGSMKVLERYFADRGYRVRNLDYPGRFESVAELTERLRDAIAPLCEATDTPVHFVTHSMGGILLRYYVERHGCPALGRVVMLAPPNQGTELVDQLGEGAFFQWALGPAAQELGTGPGSILGNLGPVDFELGVITGNASFSPITSAMIPGEDDGVVSVESARVEGMKDFLVVPSTHAFIMTSQTVLEQARHFIETGAFRPGSDEPTYPRR
jgi:pimeloyl-ACP methyl ester carboxylesterase